MKNPPIPRQQSTIENFLFSGNQINPKLDIDREQTKNEILVYLENNPELATKFCVKLMSNLLRYPDNFTNFQDENIITINKIKNSLEILNTLGADLSDSQKAAFSLGI